MVVTLFAFIIVAVTASDLGLWKCVVFVSRNWLLLLLLLLVSLLMLLLVSLFALLAPSCCCRRCCCGCSFEFDYFLCQTT